MQVDDPGQRVDESWSRKSSQAPLDEYLTLRRTRETYLVVQHASIVESGEISARAEEARKLRCMGSLPCGAAGKGIHMAELPSFSCFSSFSPLSRMEACCMTRGYLLSPHGRVSIQRRLRASFGPALVFPRSRLSPQGIVHIHRSLRASSGAPLSTRYPGSW